MERVPPFNAQQLESISKTLADTDDGFTGSELGYLLQQCHIPDVSPDMTKWKRLFNALVAMQKSKEFGNHVVVLITEAMNPARYTADPLRFKSRQDRLNAVLAFAGMSVGSDGKVRRTSRAADLDDALARASRLHASLLQRGVHPDVLTFCKAELLQENYFHAVFEAMKSIASKIRYMTGLTSDGADLVTAAFSLGKLDKPLLAINQLQTETDKGEQRGFANLLIGLFGTIRNPSAHNPKIEWPMSEQDALDILTMASLIHRKIDAARKPT
jgi:uncharacterized protein (TIGR02391 family)